MSDLTCGVSGSTGAEVVDRINENSIVSNPINSAWSGVTLADEQALRDFYGDQSITVQGANFSAKSYPDGSVVGSTDNGSFEMRANGRLECGEARAGSGGITVTYSIVFITVPLLTLGQQGPDANAETGMSVFSRLTTVNGVQIQARYTNGTTWDLAGEEVSYLAVGRWK